ncbi:hypothetical protein VCSRO79_1908 [Vibrio cholerae]|nr:hypothetical protein VCSRO79_1908 [Vibrio cholerae]
MKNAHLYGRFSEVRKQKLVDKALWEVGENGIDFV